MANQCVKTILDLRNLSPGNEQCETAMVLGYHSPGDGGGDLFFWEEGSIDEHNGGTIIKGSPDVGRWKRLYDVPSSVKWFGAKGDGTGNDQPAIQAACNFEAARGGEVVMPCGTYRTSDTTLPAGTILRDDIILPNDNTLQKGSLLDATTLQDNTILSADICLCARFDPQLTSVPHKPAM